MKIKRDAARSWQLCQLAIENLAKHLKPEESSRLLDALYSCPLVMQDIDRIMDGQ